MALFPGVALVTGAASGIGRQTAISFAVEGCKRIAICDRNPVGLAETRSMVLNALKVANEGTSTDSFEVQIESINVDVMHEETITHMVKTIVDRWGRIDYAVNAAGVLGNNQRSTDTSAQQFDDINGINYRGAWLCSRAELAQMLKQEPLPSHDSRPGNRGSVVNIASQLGIVSRSNAPAYCGSKAAVIGMTRADAIDYSKDNIRINCICPGVIATPMAVATPSFAESLKVAIATAPMNRMGTAQEIADAALFLSSSKATFIQGASLVVDGGYIIN